MGGILRRTGSFSGILLLAAGQVLAGQALPGWFEPNRGQAEPGVQFVMHGGAQAAYFTKDGATLQLRRRTTGAVDAFNLRMNLAGKHLAGAAAGVEPLAGRVHYLKGRNPAGWLTDIPTYGRLTYRGVYPGVDLTYYESGGQLEYDFVALPGADTSAIGIEFEGARSVRLTPEGDLALETDGGEIRSKKPLIYQNDANGQRRVVPGGYRLSGSRVSFQIAKYDRKRPLVIDPVLVYASYLGGSKGDLGVDVRADATGMYATGTTYSNNLPTTTGTLRKTAAGALDAFVVKLDPSGGNLIYATYIGGNDQDVPNGMALAADGSVYLAGLTGSTDFPVTAGAFGTGFGGGLDDAFVVKLAPAGNALTYATYVGGSGNDDATSLFVDAAGNAYVAGVTASTDFPTTTGVVQRAFAGGVSDAFVFKLNPAGSAQVFSTYVGGSGSEGFVSPLTGNLPSSISLAFGAALWVDGAGNSYLGGATDSTDFPVTAGAYSRTPAGGLADGYVVKLSSTGAAITFGTFLGGSGFDVVTGLRTDAAGNVVFAGITTSVNLPTTATALNKTYLGGYSDAFVGSLNTTGTTLNYSSFVGGADEESYVALDLASNGHVLVSGLTYSGNLPVTTDTYQPFNRGNGDVFLMLLNSAMTSVLDCSYFGTDALDFGTVRFGTGPKDLLLAGWTEAKTLTGAPGAYQPVFGGGTSDMLLARFAIGPLAQNIVFPTLPDLAFSTNTFKPAATASSGLPLTITSSTSSVCTVGGASIALVGVGPANIVTLTGTGTCTLTANQAGNTNYTAATPVTRSFVVTPGAQTITFGALASVSLSSGPVALAATASSGLAVSFASSFTNICTVSGTTVTLAAAGTCSITATQAGDSRYAAAAPVTRTFAVTQGTQTITFASLSNVNFGLAPIALSATASSGLPVTLISTTTGVCTVSGSALTLLTVGTCSVTASQAGNANYAVATAVTRSFTVAKGTQTITFGALPDISFSGFTMPANATASSGLAVTLTSTTPSICTVALNVITPVTVGTCSISASQAGDANWTAATALTRGFTISKGTQTITFPAIPNTAQSDGSVALGATASSGLTVSYSTATTLSI